MVLGGFSEGVTGGTPIARAGGHAQQNHQHEGSVKSAETSHPNIHPE